MCVCRRGGTGRGGWRERGGRGVISLCRPNDADTSHLAPTVMDGGQERRRAGCAFGSHGVTASSLPPASKVQPRLS